MLAGCLLMSLPHNIRPNNFVQKSLDNQEISRALKDWRCAILPDLSCRVAGFSSIPDSTNQVLLKTLISRVH